MAILFYVFLLISFIVVWGILGLIGLIVGVLKKNIFFLHINDIYEHILYGPIAIYFHLFK